MPERLDGVPGKIASREISQRHRHHDRQIASQIVRRLHRRHHRCLRVERVEDRFDEDEIDPAFDQGIDLFAVHVLQEIELDLAIPRIVDLGRQRQGLVRGAQRAGDKTGSAILRCELIRDAACQPGRFYVDLAHEMFGPVVRLADPVGGKSVGFGNVGARFEIGAVDRCDDLRLGKREDIVVALLVVRQVEIAGIGRLVQFPVLDFRAERPVGDQDALGGLRLQLFASAHHEPPLGRRPSMWQIA